jgi:transposase
MAIAGLKFSSNDNRPLKLFFEDEGRFGRSNNLSRCWTPKGKRASVRKQIVRQYTYAFSSVCPETGETHSLILPYSNTEMMSYYLQDLSKYFEHYRIILCTDQAGWHVSFGLNIPDNISILLLPPYSPQLNPVEHLWKYIREQKGFNNRIFQSIDEVTNCLSEALAAVANEEDIIRSLCHYNWL